MDSRQEDLARFAALMPTATQAMDIAAAIIGDHRPAVITAKGDRDMVSEIDVQIERAVRGFLHDQAADIGFMGEEEGGTSGGELQWVLDPIDGTANFVKGIPLYAISLALVSGGEPVLGDYAVGDQAAIKNPGRLAVTAQLAQRALRVRMFGSAAIDLAWLAHGRTDAAIISGGKPWDIAAGIILVREAGGTVTDALGSRHSFVATSTVATSPQLLAQILDLMAGTNANDAHS